MAAFARCIAFRAVRGNGLGVRLFGKGNEQWRALMRKALARGFVALILLSGVGTVLSACNTMEGAGQDMSAGGHALSNSAEKNK